MLLLRTMVIIQDREQNVLIIPMHLRHAGNILQENELEKPREKAYLIEWPFHWSMSIWPSCNNDLCCFIANSSRSISNDCCEVDGVEYVDESCCSLWQSNCNNLYLTMTAFLEWIKNKKSDIRWLYDGLLTPLPFQVKGEEMWSRYYKLIFSKVQKEISKPRYADGPISVYE